MLLCQSIVARCSSCDISDSFGSSSHRMENIALTTLNHVNHAVVRPKIRVVSYIMFQQCASSYLKKKAHRKEGYFFKNFALPLHFCTVFFYHFRHGRKKHTMGLWELKIWVFGPPGPFWMLRGPKIFGLGCVAKHQVFSTWCLCPWCRLCLWRVPWSVSCVLMTCFCAVHF